MTTPIAAVGSTVPQSAMTGPSSADNTKLSSKAFLQLLVAQLQYQDPSKPVDTSSFMNETATLTQVQAMEQSSQNSTDMLTAQRAQTASTLVGHSVSYTDNTGATKTGTVSAATISAAEPMLKISGASETIPLSAVQQVLAATP
jgi:flagellar basal-body rod modification protein FlgD